MACVMILNASLSSSIFFYRLFNPLYWGINQTPKLQIFLVQRSIFLKQMIKKALCKQAEAETYTLSVGIDAVEITRRYSNTGYTQEFFQETLV